MSAAPTSAAAPIRVAAALLRDGRGRLLAGRRPAGKACAGMWEFVGGKLEPGETAPQALARECREETGADVVAEGFARRVEHDYPVGRVAVDFLWARLRDGSPAPVAREHGELRFFAPEELPSLPFCPADAPVAAWIAAGRAAPRLLLASASPRRFAILSDLGADFLFRPVSGDEPRGADPAESVRAAALAKHAAAAARRAAEGAGPPAVLAADTLVECDGRILGKPRDRADAVETLLFLSGREHRVHTAVAASAAPDAEPEVFEDAATVRFRTLTRADAEAYLDAARTLDRAGAYDIATLGERVVAGLSGSFTCVMGLPAERTGAWLRAHNLL